ncbi:hypothetical protein MRB53_024195 [Persea americana]|uniref:Uncharacterized protein n=1 Tax=Persea americana TaxID=3435 RepID=A0ACC2LCQ2_PERAE|nr:hypothetical protein MRB53_024195 [Persea americana]
MICLFLPLFLIIESWSRVSPLGCGVESTWRRLIDGGCEIRAISLEDLKMEGFDEEAHSQAFNQLTCKVVAFIPCGSGTTGATGDGDNGYDSEFN